MLCIFLTESLINDFLFSLRFGLKELVCVLSAASVFAVILMTLELNRLNRRELRDALLERLRREKRKVIVLSGVWFVSLGSPPPMNTPSPFLTKLSLT